MQCNSSGAKFYYACWFYKMSQQIPDYIKDRVTIVDTTKMAYISAPTIQDCCEFLIPELEQVIKRFNQILVQEELDAPDLKELKRKLRMLMRLIP